MSFRDWVEDFPAAIDAVLAAKVAIAAGAWYLIPVAAVLAVAMQNSGEAAELSPRRESLYATEICARYPKYTKVRHKGQLYLKYPAA
jgi:hypothetical protein